MNCTREPTIQSCYTDQRVPYFDRCQLTITWISIINLLESSGINYPYFTFVLIACVSQTFNLVFVVDGSGSIEDQGKGNFQRAKNFIIEIIKSFNIGKDATQVALVLYNSEPDVVFEFKYKFDDIEKKIREMHYPDGGTNTGKALDKVRNYVFKKLKKDREGLPKVVVVVTDGRSQDNVSVPAQQLRDDGATIISLGVGCCFDEDELNEMATDPDEKHVLEASFSELDKFKDAMKEQICSGELRARISHYILQCV